MHWNGLSSCAVHYPVTKLSISLSAVHVQLYRPLSSVVVTSDILVIKIILVIVIVSF